MSNAGFSFSGVAHGAILAWLIMGSPNSGDDRAQSVYDLQIRAHEDRIVWYHPADRLPDVAPSGTTRNAAPPRARVLHRQTLISSTREEALAAPKIWLPDVPELSKQKLPPLPNALAVAPATPPPRLVRPFTAPSVEPKATPVSPSLPDAPKAASLLPAPAAMVLSNEPAKAPPRRFTPPPPQASRRPDDRLPQSAFSEPVLLQAAASAEATLAIASLTPAATREIPKPSGPRDAAFSAGPKLNPEGGDGPSPSDRSILVVPGLLARGGDRVPAPALAAGVAVRQANLLAGVRAPLTGGAAPSSAAPPGAIRVSESPDPRLAGRAVYTLAIQMPNVTSYFGSWIVWFAEHEPAGEPASLRPPSPLRKVDPKYIASAVSDRVEGTVRLFAVIGKDGRVDGISLIRRLDERLDRSASEALAKWQFEPATRGGIPIEVDAVFEIPFHLAPRTAR